MFAMSVAVFGPGFWFGWYAERQMPGSGTSTFTDPDDYQASLRRPQLDLVVTARGAFKARLTWATLHQLHLQRNEEDSPRIAYVSLSPALVFVGFTTRPDPPMLWALRQGGWQQ